MAENNSDKMLRRVVSRYLLKTADSRGNMIRVLGLSKQEAEMFHNASPKLGFTLAKWWKESKTRDSASRFIMAPFATWVLENPGKSGNWKKLPYEKAFAKYEQIAFRDPSEDGSVVMQKNGFQWIRYTASAMGQAKCPLWVRDFLGHCGKTDSGDMLVLFDPRGKPRLTATLQGRKLVDIVGRGHSDPKSKYYPFVEALSEKMRVSFVWGSDESEDVIEEISDSELDLRLHNSAVSKLKNMLQLTPIISGEFSGNNAVIIGDVSGNKVEVSIGSPGMNAFQALTGGQKAVIDTRSLKVS